jgi:hypothetical protein
MFSFAHHDEGLESRMRMFRKKKASVKADRHHDSLLSHSFSFQPFHIAHGVAILIQFGGGYKRKQYITSQTTIIVTITQTHIHDHGLLRTMVRISESIYIVISWRDAKIRHCSLCRPSHSTLLLPLILYSIRTTIYSHVSTGRYDQSP